MTNTLVNFDNFFNYIILSSIFLLRKKYLQKMMFGKNGQFPFAWGIMIKTWGRVLLGSMSKIEQIQFLTHRCSLNTINLKLFHNYGGIYQERLRRDKALRKP